MEYKKWISLYKHPRWIRKRNIILKRDGYKCTVCGDKNNLQVHHTYYIRDLVPWSYPNKSLLTLCEPCHHEYHVRNEVVFKKPHKSNKRKTKPIKVRQPRKSDLNKVKHKIRSPIYKKKINGVWFKFEVRY